MEIQNIINQKQWDGWLADNASTGNFAQSWAWGDVLISEGKKVERLAIVEGGVVLAQAQVVYSQIFFGWQYAFCPQGPIISSQFVVHSSQIYECFLVYFKKQNCIFFRAEPETLVLSSQLIVQKTIDINPSATLILDLNKSLEDLLAGMHSKTRYNIHLAEKKKIEIKNEKNLEVFWGLMNKTGSRDKFGLHHKSHYEKVLASQMVYQLTAYHEDKPVACAVFVRFGNTFTYLYGASDYEYRNLMAPYLLQWEGMKMGKSFGCARYDFFGVAPRYHSEPPKGDKLREENMSQSINGQASFGELIPQDDSYKYDSNHQYAGVTRFKLGFGGASQQMPGTFDLVIDKKKYFIYGLLRKLRRLF
jgi:lipid II:glycine glycyltransferase (peptidoglycan interpeptide bridge formation enzyme)